MRPQAPYLIAVAGLSPRAGTTTTTVALAHTWPGAEAALIVEADPAGGQLAEMVGADPHLGVASLARRRALGLPVAPELLAQHVQYLPGGQAFVAAPPGHDPDDPVPAAALLTDPDRGWRGLGATVFADCGVPEPGSPAHPVIATADAALFVVRAEHIEPETAAQRVLDLTRRRRPRGIVVIGGSRAYVDAIGFPVVGQLPASRAGARAVLTGRRSRQHLIPPARHAISAVESQLRRYEHTGQFDPPRTGQPARQGEGRGGPVRRRRRDEDGPRIYSIDPATVPTPVARPVPAEPVVVDAAEPSPSLVRESALVDTGESAGHSRETDLSAAPEPIPDNHTAPAESAPKPAPEPVPAPAETPALRVRVFGPTRVFWRVPDSGESVEITGQLQPRLRELLAVLALHPRGLSRSQLTELLWGQRPADRSSGVLTNTLSRLRTALGAATGGRFNEPLADDRVHYRLSETAVSVDWWDFTAAVTARRRASNDTDRTAACRAITAIATEELAPDLTDAWTEPIRESARRDTHNALGWLATHDADHDPRATLELLETTAQTDPYNEALWRDILRQHARLGEYPALDRAYALLTRKLAEIGETPSRETVQLLEHLRRGEGHNPDMPGR
ncbi:winged helix-turn-helix domain-containing protein [Nocardia puris]|uniref:DNA-binding SARP family transcriptional activator n=1 Tax=Nocardia puris TaxID=208602 RepID=A0A366CU25_9NOCA|nr:winged helix-turn-helix domain-containing protein [Nocardia puris]RBO79800.1 DNA-binding SARP family transcriptional activator [Nocardia puris]